VKNPLDQSWEETSAADWAERMTWAPDLINNRHCMTIVPSEFDYGKGYVPCMVVGGHAGYFPMRGGDDKRPWYWGLELERAREVCAEYNSSQLGLTPEDVTQIIASSMKASRQGVRPGWKPGEKP
jgi:hypothetical protein